MAGRPRFNLKNKTKEKTLICLVYWLNGKRIVFSTGISIEPKNWNDKNMRARTGGRFLDGQIINDNLSRIEEAARTVDREFRVKGEKPTQEQFKAGLANKLAGGRPEAEMTFNDFLERFILERAALPNYSKATIQVYRTTQNHYLRFVRGRVIEFRDLTQEHLEQFVNDLRKRGLGDNTTHKFISTLRAIIREASRKGLTASPTFNIRDANLTRRESDSVYLNEKELATLKEIDLSGNERLAKVRDLFIIGAYTGLRFSDFTNIKPENIQTIDGNRILSIPVIKTQDRVEIPIHKFVDDIILKNEGYPPGKISSQKFNQYIKELCEQVGFTDAIVIRTFHGGQMKIASIPKYQLVSSHTARRSFATNAYKAGINNIAIMKITGHKQVTTFMKYIKISKIENAIELSNHSFFKG